MRSLIIILYLISVVSGKVLYDHKIRYKIDEYLTVENDGLIDDGCNRECQCQEQPRRCKYTLIIEDYMCDLADGRPTFVKAFNRSIPGPSIQVCQGDMVEVKVINLSNETTSVHWHGMLMKGTIHSDGVSYITQHPIKPGKSFIYKFYTNEETGTSWYHPHEGFERCLGAFGAIIVKDPCDSEKCLDRNVLISDWFYDRTITNMDNLLINGKGRKIGSDPDDLQSYPIVKVPRNKPIKFRFILNVCLSIPVEIFIPGISFSMRNSDTHCIKHYEVQSILALSGERYDAVATFDQNGTYLIHFRSRKFVTILRVIVGNDFVQHTSFQPSYVLNGPQFNSFDETSRYPGVKDIPMGKAERCDPYELHPKYENKIFETKYIVVGSSKDFNYISFRINRSISYLDIWNQDNVDRDNLFCSPNITQCNSTSRCFCTQALFFECGCFYELAIINLSKTFHPIHIHGSKMIVVGQGYNVPKEDLLNVSFQYFNF